MRRTLRPFEQAQVAFKVQAGATVEEVAQEFDVPASEIATRYKKKAMITSNKSLTEWVRVLHDTALAAALVDRLLHPGEVYYLKDDSYRLRGKPKTESPEPAETPAQGGQRDSHPPRNRGAMKLPGPRAPGARAGNGCPRSPASYREIPGVTLRTPTENRPGILRRWRILSENWREKVVH